MTGCNAVETSRAMENTCSNTGDNKNVNLSLFYYKTFSWLKIEFYENDFIGYILGKEREGRTKERAEQVYYSTALMTIFLLIFILIFQVLLNNKRCN